MGRNPEYQPSKSIFASRDTGRLKGMTPLLRSPLQISSERNANELLQQVGSELVPILYAEQKCYARRRASLELGTHDNTSRPLHAGRHKRIFLGRAQVRTPRLLLSEQSAAERADRLGCLEFRYLRLGPRSLPFNGSRSGQPGRHDVVK